MIEDYFTGEKVGALLLLLFGILSILISVFFILKVKRPFENGLSIPLSIFALLQLIIGSVVFNRSAHLQTQVSLFTESSPSSISTIEIPRVETVLTQLEWLQYFEIGLFVLGFLLIFIFWKKPFRKGIAVGLVVESALVFIIDYFAFHRAETYLHELKIWVAG